MPATRKKKARTTDTGRPEPVAPPGACYALGVLIVKVDNCPYFRPGVLPFLVTRHSSLFTAFGISICSLPGIKKRPGRNSARGRIPLLPRCLRALG
jgi:hypothetical protein